VWPCCFCDSDAGGFGFREELLQASRGRCAELSWLRVAHDEECGSLLSGVGYRSDASADAASRRFQGPHSVHCCSFGFVCEVEVGCRSWTVGSRTMVWLVVYNMNIYRSKSCCYSIYIYSQGAGKHSAFGQRNRRRRNIHSAVNASSRATVGHPESDRQGQVERLTDDTIVEISRRERVGVSNTTRGMPVPGFGNTRSTRKTSNF
jgi:hypothetical protein